MAVSNITGFSVGQDLQTLLIVPQSSGAPINATSLGRLLEFNATPVISEVSMTPISDGGIQLVRNIYHGWNGDINFGRYNGNLASLMAAVMGIFNQIGLESYFSIEAVVVDSASGSQTPTTYTFTNCVISQVPVGDFAGTKDVNQKLVFRAQQMLVNGTAATALPSFS